MSDEFNFLEAADTPRKTKHGLTFNYTAWLTGKDAATPPPARATNIPPALADHILSKIYYALLDLDDNYWDLLRAERANDTDIESNNVPTRIKEIADAVLKIPGMTDELRYARWLELQPK